MSLMLAKITFVKMERLASTMVHRIHVTVHLGSLERTAKKILLIVKTIPVHQEPLASI
jgi:hypothetical protein